MPHYGLVLVCSNNQELAYYKLCKDSIVSYTIVAAGETLNLALNIAFPLNYLSVPQLKLKQRCIESILNFDGKINCKPGHK